MTRHVKSTTTDPETLALIGQVFLNNSITYAPSDYAVVRVEDMLIVPDPTGNNSYLYLSPITTNSTLPNLRLAYERRDIEVVMENLNPYFFDATEDTVVQDIIEQVNDVLNGALVLKKTDFYDTCLVTDNGSNYIRMFAHPRSLFYRGSKQVPQRSRTEPFYLSFTVELTPRVV